MPVVLGGGGGGVSPLDDWAPYMYASPINTLYTYYDTGAYHSQNTQFWTATNLQGAYINDSTVSAFTDIVNISGAGHLWAIFSGCFSGNQDVTFEVTLDGTAREYRIYTPSGQRAVAIFSRHNMGLKDIYNNRTGFSSADTKAYSHPYLTASNNTGNTFIPPAAQASGVRYNTSLRVRVKGSTGTTFTGSFQEYHGVWYVTD